MMTTTTTTTTLQANVDKVIAAMKARGLQRTSTVETLAWDTELPVREIRAALRVARAQKLIRIHISEALGVRYYLV